MTDWSLLEGWLKKAAAQRAVAVAYRAEAENFRQRIVSARTAGTHSPRELQALGLTRMHYIGEAARIERALRGVDRNPGF